MPAADDRLFNLLPTVYRARDEAQGFPLRALLRVIATQVDAVETDIQNLYENWFIETCDDWVVPYIGELIGYQAVQEAGQPGDPSTKRGLALDRILTPRREVADTIALRRRKGTLAVLEEIANSSAGWPAHAVEFYRLLAWTQSLNHLYPQRGGTVDLRDGEKLIRLRTAFDEIAHTVDVRRVSSTVSQGRFNIPSVGVFVWRLRAYQLGRSQTRRVNRDRNGYTFSPLGNDAPVFSTVDGGVPAPVRLRTFERRPADFYGPGKAFEVFTGGTAVPLADVIAANLSEWDQPVHADQVAIDPIRGRLIFGRRPKTPIEVSYSYGFSAEMGGGPYARTLHNPDGATTFHVPKDFPKIQDALRAAHDAKLPEAIVEIGDNATYRETLNITVAPESGLQIRSANGKRPVIRIEDDDQDMNVSVGPASRFLLDGIMVEGGRIYVQRSEGADESALDERPLIWIRHATLVPGWALEHDCCPRRGEEPSIVLDDTAARLVVGHSILGTIHVEEDLSLAPLPVHLHDSILDATNLKIEAFSAVFGDDNVVRKAHAVATVERCTVFGGFHAHAIELAEDSIFMSEVRVARSQVGCMRFCYAPPESRTPQRYRCQPDLVPVSDQQRVRPSFTSMRFGEPAYCQLGSFCAAEIKTGASDESEMGAFHDLFQPQRAANLRVRLDEFTPAGMNAGILFAS